MREHYSVASNQRGGIDRRALEETIRKIGGRLDKIEEKLEEAAKALQKRY